MSFRVQNRPVSRRELYGTVVGVLAFVELAVVSMTHGDSFRTPLEVAIVIAMLWASIELVRTR